MEKSTFIRNTEGRDYAIDQTLDQIELVVNPSEFYRVNRSCIIGINSIRDIVAYSNSRLKIVPTVKVDEDIIVSRERVSGFKEWLERWRTNKFHFAYLEIWLSFASNFIYDLRWCSYSILPIRELKQVLE